MGLAPESNHLLRILFCLPWCKYSLLLRDAGHFSEFWWIWSSSASAEPCVVLPSHLASLSQVCLFEPRGGIVWGLRDGSNVVKCLLHCPAYCRHTDSSDIAAHIMISIYTHKKAPFLICTWWHLSGRLRAGSVPRRDGFSHLSLLDSPAAWLQISCVSFKAGPHQLLNPLL